MSSTSAAPPRPPRIAVVGASTNRRKYGNKAVRAFREAGWTVYPVNLDAETIEGLEVFPTLADLPSPVERISVYLHPQDTMKLLPEIQQTGCDDIWLNPGSADMSVLERCHEMGLAVVNACSIVDIGMRPADFS
jgi:predicted CoA-binding protein